MTLTRSSSRCGMGPSRSELERVSVIEPNGLNRRERLLKIFFGLAGETDYDVGRQRDVWNRFAQSINALEIPLAGVSTKHSLERPCRPGLHRQVDVLAER